MFFGLVDRVRRFFSSDDPRNSRLRLPIAWQFARNIKENARDCFLTNYGSDKYVRIIKCIYVDSYESDYLAYVSVSRDASVISEFLGRSRLTLLNVAFLWLILSRSTLYTRCFRRYQRVLRLLTKLIATSTKLLALCWIRFAPEDTKWCWTQQAFTTVP